MSLRAALSMLWSIFGGMATAGTVGRIWAVDSAPARRYLPGDPTGLTYLRVERKCISGIERGMELGGDVGKIWEVSYMATPVLSRGEKIAWTCSTQVKIPSYSIAGGRVRTGATKNP
jgi:hypothetical protein